MQRRRPSEWLQLGGPAPGEASAALVNVTASLTFYAAISGEAPGDLAKSDMETIMKDYGVRERWCVLITRTFSDMVV